MNITAIRLLEALSSRSCCGVPVMLKQVLFCEDQSPMFRAAEVQLRRVGFHVRRVPNAEQAWHAIQESRPDLVVTDCPLADLEGRQLITRIRRNETTATLPVLILTTAGEPPFEIAAAGISGVTDVLCKPFSPRELCQRVQQALEKSSPAHLPISNRQSLTAFPPATIR